MAIRIVTDFKTMPWKDLGCLRMFVECSPRGRIKHRWLLLQRIKFEQRHRQKKGLIPNFDTNTYFPDASDKAASGDKQSGFVTTKGGSL